MPIKAEKFFVDGKETKERSFYTMKPTMGNLLTVTMIG